VKRAIKVVFNDGTEPIELVLSKAASIDSPQQMINLDKLKDGTWRLIYNENLIPDFSKVKGFEVVRED
jgi:hypothetical protein